MIADQIYTIDMTNSPSPSDRPGTFSLGSCRSRRSTSVLSPSEHTCNTLPAHMPNELAGTEPGRGSPGEKNQRLTLRSRSLTWWRSRVSSFSDRRGFSWDSGCETSYQHLMLEPYLWPRCNGSPSGLLDQVDHIFWPHPDPP